MNDPAALIVKDHEALEKLFQTLEALEDNSERIKLIPMLTHELNLHTEMEETLCYPRFKEALTEESERVLIETAYAAHAEMKDKLMKLASMDEVDPSMRECAKNLIADVRKHVQDEERAVLPLIKSRVSTEILGALGDDIITFKESRNGATP